MTMHEGTRAMIANPHVLVLDCSRHRQADIDQIGFEAGRMAASERRRNLLERPGLAQCCRQPAIRNDRSRARAKWPATPGMGRQLPARLPGCQCPEGGDPPTAAHGANWPIPKK